MSEGSGTLAVSCVPIKNDLQDLTCFMHVLTCCSKVPWQDVYLQDPFHGSCQFLAYLWQVCATRMTQG